MDVTQLNYADECARMRRVLQEADFVALDTELSGLHVPDAVSTPDHRFTSFEARYRRLRIEASTYTIIQMGIAAFKRREEDPSTYAVHCYNVYCFPRHHKKNVRLNQVFSCEPAAMQFLIEHDFDWNTWARHGLPTLNMEQLAACRAAHTDAGDGNQLQVNADDMLFMEDCVIKVDALIKQSGGVTSVDLPQCNAFRRRYVHQEIPRRFPNHYFSIQTMNAPDGNRREKPMRVSLTTKEEAESKRAVEENQFFCMHDLLSQLRGPVILHNGLTDLTRIYHQYYAPLPEDLLSFKAAVMRAFPHGLVDTKLLVETLPDISMHIAESSLQEAVDKIRRLSHFSYGPSVECEPGFKKYEAADAAHEAGFDALCTGELFLALTWYLGHIAVKEEMSNGGYKSLSKVDQRRNWLVEAWMGERPVATEPTPSEKGEQEDDDAMASDGEEEEEDEWVGESVLEQMDWSLLWKEWRNYIFVMRSEGIKRLDLAKPDVMPDRQHVFYIGGLPPKVFHREVPKLFLEALQEELGITPYYFDDWIIDFNWTRHEHDAYFISVTHDEKVPKVREAVLAYQKKAERPFLIQLFEEVDYEREDEEMTSNKKHRLA